MKRQKIRKLITLISLLLFPITINYLSPYLIVMGASEGIINGSFIFFALLFFSGLMVGRGYCGWLCPAIFLQESCISIKDRPVDKAKDRIKYALWVLWLGIIAFLAIRRGGYSSIDPLYMTEKVISVDGPGKYIIYYSVVAIFLLLPLLMGKRAGCHTICWMAPFMVIGNKVSRTMGLPSLQLAASKEQCIHCKLCNKKCPMGLEVGSMVEGNTYNPECVLCGECIDSCPKNVLYYRFGRPVGKQKYGAK